MLNCKFTNYFSEIGKFFKENDANSAMNMIMHMSNTLKLSEYLLFGENSKCNCKLNKLQILQVLILLPCFMVKNVYNYSNSILFNMVGCKKDVFYDFLSNDQIDWRKILRIVTFQLWRKIQQERTSEQTNPRCLMIDDTDFPKRGMHTELIGKIYSHVEHRMKLGFKALFLGITDGMSQMLLDLALLGEEGKKGDYGLKQKQLDARFSKQDRPKDSKTSKRIEEYDINKITLMIEMIKRVIKHKIHFDYVLADSWFACAEIIQFITRRHIKCHYLGMIKMGNTKYQYKGKDYTAKQLVNLLNSPKKGRKRNNRLACYYITVDVIFAGREVRLFFTKRSKHAKWNGLITTNRELTFLQAYKIYSMRWSLEVVFKEAKGNLGLGKYQVRNFASQIACTTITAIQYNLLSIAKRFSDYETIGGLFHDAVDKAQELSVTERIWKAIEELVVLIAQCFDIEDENIFDTLVNKGDKLNYFVEFYKNRMVA